MSMYDGRSIIQYRIDIQRSCVDPHYCVEPSTVLILEAVFEK